MSYTLFHPLVVQPASKIKREIIPNQILVRVVWNFTEHKLDVLIIQDCVGYSANCANNQIAHFLLCCRGYIMGWILAVEC